DPVPTVQELIAFLMENWLTMLPGDIGAEALDWRRTASGLTLTIAAGGQFNRSHKLDLEHDDSEFGLGLGAGGTVDFAFDIDVEYTFEIDWVENSYDLTIDTFDVEALLDAQEIVASGSLG